MVWEVESDRNEIWRIARMAARMTGRMTGSMTARSKKRVRVRELFMNICPWHFPVENM